MNTHPNIFKERLKHLQTTYHLSLSELGECIGVQKTAVALYESGKNMPSFETLINIANLFGVTIDWLVGRSDIPYTEDSVKASENFMAERKREFDDQNLIDKYTKLHSEIISDKNLVKESPAIYNSHDQLAIRANISVLTQIAFLNDVVEYKQYRDSPSIKKRIENKLFAPPGKQLNKRFSLRAKLYIRLLNGMSEKPYFDIEKKNTDTDSINDTDTLSN